MDFNRRTSAFVGRNLERLANALRPLVEGANTLETPDAVGSGLPAAEAREVIEANLGHTVFRKLVNGARQDGEIGDSEVINYMRPPTTPE